MVVLADQGDILGLDLLPPEMREPVGPAGAAAASGAGNAGDAGRSLRSSVSELERRVISEALDRHRWNKAKVARELGLSYPTLLARIRNLELERRRS
jgi:DNA-binding NtrC family response regulator